MATKKQFVPTKPTPKQYLKPGDKGYASANKQYQTENKRAQAWYIAQNKKDFINKGGTEKQWASKVKSDQRMTAKAKKGK